MNDKDQAAIDHVASVSNNPHAAMIVKQLITGWDLKSNITGTIIKNTTWIDGHEWQLIEPKPAYRVYRDKGCTITYTQDRDTSGAVSTVCCEDDVEWLSEWIEYDPPKKWPTPLVERIAAIDLEAAEWIVENWDDPSLNNKDTEKLHFMFVWEASPQGSQYWRIIAKQLGEQ